MADILLGHGASGSAATMKPYVDGLVARGVAAVTVPTAGKLPGRAEKALEVFVEALSGAPGAAVGGHSYGGRVASMLAAEHDDVRGLVLFSYPLHRPGHPEELRTGHWATIRCPVLLLSGESDGFARIELLRAAVAGHGNFELVSYPSVGHGLTRNASTFADALDRTATFIQALPGAG